jgi:hypothetical protein
MGSANNIIHPTRLREIGSSVRRFERVMMSVGLTVFLRLCGVRRITARHNQRSLQPTPFKR